MKFLFNLAFLDAATPWQLGFQDPATPIIIGIIHFHNHLIFFLVIIGTFVFWLLYKALVLFKEDPTREASKFTHSTPLEVVWTITPALLLLLIAGPSFALLYSIDEVIAPHMSLKVIGHQWYWSYEYSDYQEPVTGESIKFDSYIVAEDDLSLGGLRLLEVDNRVKLPINVHIRVLVSSADVLHSWAVPSLGIKIDACPGRLNQVSLFLMRKGVFYGQCSEICGVNHAFIPIVVEGLTEESYLNWVKSSLAGNSSSSGEASSSPISSSSVEAGSSPVESGPDSANPESSSSNFNSKPTKGEKSSKVNSAPVDPIDPIAWEWAKKSQMYQEALAENRDLIAEMQAVIKDYCNDPEQRGEISEYQCKVDFIKNSKQNIAWREKLRQLQLLNALLENFENALKKGKSSKAGPGPVESGTDSANPETSSDSNIDSSNSKASPTKEEPTSAKEEKLSKVE